MTDAEICTELTALDSSDVSDWEADFIESVVFRRDDRLSERQRATAEGILERYRGKY